MIKPDPMQSTERRRYFRIDDQVALKYRVIDEAGLESALTRFQIGYPDKMTLASAFASTSSQMKRSVDRFRRDMPDVAAYLEGLNEKLDLLVQLLAASDEDFDDGPTHGVTLSASGISFRSSEPIPIGSLVEVKFLVFPTYVCVQCFGTVIRSLEIAGAETDPYDIGVEFTHIREVDRELIFRHVTKRQSELLREAKTVLDDGSQPPG